MKNIIENALKQILLPNKIFRINLCGGNEKCIQGDLYSELNKNTELHVALEYPIGKREHADIALFEDDSYKVVSSIIELKHYSPHQPNPEQSTVENVFKEVEKRLVNKIPEIYVIQIMTQVEHVANPNQLTNYPFCKSYVKDEKNIRNVVRNEKLKSIFDKILLEVDRNVRYLSVSQQVDNSVVVRLHFYICGPFRQDLLDSDGKLIMNRFPIVNS